MVNGIQSRWASVIVLTCSQEAKARFILGFDTDYPRFSWQLVVCIFLVALLWATFGYRIFQTQKPNFTMKYNALFLCLLFLTISCGENKKENSQEQNLEASEVEPGPGKLDFDVNSHENLKDWLGYYKTKAPGFSLNVFELQRTDTLDFMKGSVLGSFHPDFEELYYDFIVYNQDSTHYLDFDSYKWGLDENGKIMLSPDQEINVVDLEEKTVTRIGFRGPSYWVENAFWEKGPVVVLLENSSEKQPTIHRINLENRTVETYSYQDTLEFGSTYFEKRLKEKGIEVEQPVH